MSQPSVSSADVDFIWIEWGPVSFDGGDSVVSYNVRRDDGPGTAF